MRTNIRQLVILSCLCIPLWPPLAWAQSTLGELLDKGAKQVSKDEWMAMAPFTSRGVSPSGQAETELFFKPDGKVGGTLYPNGHGNCSIRGTWTIKESGAICVAWLGEHHVVEVMTGAGASGNLATTCSINIPISMPNAANVLSSALTESNLLI